MWCRCVGHRGRRWTVTGALLTCFASCAAVPTFRRSPATSECFDVVDRLNQHHSGIVTMSGESWLSMAAGMRRRIAGYVYGQYTLCWRSNHMYRFYFLSRPTPVTSLILSCCTLFLPDLWSSSRTAINSMWVSRGSRSSTKNSKCYRRRWNDRSSALIFDPSSRLSRPRFESTRCEAPVIGNNKSCYLSDRQAGEIGCSAGKLLATRLSASSPCVCSD